MSSSIAAAKKRRAGITPSAPENKQSTNTNTVSAESAPGNGLTLQQVISLIDKRLIALETVSRNTNTPATATVNLEDSSSISGSEEISPNTLNEIIDEFQHRFVMLADEIAALKDIVIKLQSYTMDVNKTLMEERIQILSDLGEHNQTYILEERDTENIVAEEVVGENVVVEEVVAENVVVEEVEQTTDVIE